jgi:hypothetical protein
MSTGFGAVVGTLEYMSPQQASHNGHLGNGRRGQANRRRDLDFIGPRSPSALKIRYVLQQKRPPDAKLAHDKLC